MLCKCFIIRQHCWATVQQRDKLKRVSGTCPMSVAFAVASTYYVCFASTELPVLGTSILQAPKRSHLQLSITKNWEHSCWLQKTLKVRQSIWEHSFFFPPPQQLHDLLALLFFINEIVTSLCPFVRGKKDNFMIWASSVGYLQSILAKLFMFAVSLQFYLQGRKKSS